MEFGSFHKAEKIIMVSFRSGYIFIQTDKPVYNPGDTGQNSHCMTKHWGWVKNIDFSILNHSKLCPLLLLTQNQVSALNISQFYHKIQTNTLLALFNMARQITLSPQKAAAQSTCELIIFCFTASYSMK